LGDTSENTVKEIC